MNRTTTKVRPPAAALRLLVALVLAIGLMPLPAYAAGELAAGVRAGSAPTQNAISVKNVVDNGDGTATVTIQVDMAHEFMDSYVYFTCTGLGDIADEEVAEASGAEGVFLCKADNSAAEIYPDGYRTNAPAGTYVFETTWTITDASNISVSIDAEKTAWMYGWFSSDGTWNSSDQLAFDSLTGWPVGGDDPQPVADPVKAGNAKQGDVAYAWSYGGNITYAESTGYTVTPYNTATAGEDAAGVTYVIDTLVVDGQAVELSADQAKAAYTLEAAPTTSVFATFAYTVNFNSPDGGTLTVARADGSAVLSGNTVRGGEILKITATPDAGYELDELALTGLTAEPSAGTYRVTAENGDATPAIEVAFKEAQSGDGLLHGGETIDTNGTYRLADDATGAITVEEGVAATIVGTSWDDETESFSGPVYRDLTLRVGDGSSLTLRNVRVEMTATDGGTSFVAVDVLGDCRLNVEGVNLLDRPDLYDSCSMIHVPQGRSVTLGGSGTLYGYKHAQGAFIGANGDEANGDITFESGTWMLKGSKTGPIIGTDAAAGGKVTFNGGAVYLKTVSGGAAIGGSKQGEGLDVVVNGGLLQVATDWSGSAIGYGGNATQSAGTLTVNGGSIMPVVTPNAYSTWGIDASEHFGGVVTTSIITAENDYALLTFDASRYAGGTPIVVNVDGEKFYEGGLYEWIENEQKNPTEPYAPATLSNWLPNTDEWKITSADAYSGAYPTNPGAALAGTQGLYFLLSKEAHTLTVGGDTYEYLWDAASASFVPKSEEAHSVTVTVGANATGAGELSQQGLYGAMAPVVVTPGAGYELAAPTITPEGAGIAAERGADGSWTVSGVPAADVEVSFADAGRIEFDGTVDVAGAQIVITSPGCSVGGAPEIPYTGAYTLTGSLTWRSTESPAIIFREGSYDVTLDGVSMTMPWQKYAKGAIRLEPGASVEMVLAGESHIAFGMQMNKDGTESALIGVPEGASLTIAEQSTGSLAVETTTGTGGAAIGSDGKENLGSIVVAGGTVQVTDVRGYTNIASGDLVPSGAGRGGALIGSGTFSKTGSVTITGGTVVAESHCQALGACIGSGVGDGNAVDVTISGGTVRAAQGGGAQTYVEQTYNWVGGGSDESAAIGCGANSAVGSVTITGGVVEARGGWFSREENGSVSYYIGTAIGSAANDLFYSDPLGNTVAISGGTVSVFNDADGSVGEGTCVASDHAAVRAGAVSVTGGSLRVQARTGISRSPVNASGEPVFLAVVDAAPPVAVDGVDWGVAVPHEGDGNLYLYLTGADHVLAVGGDAYDAAWDGASGTWALTQREPEPAKSGWVNEDGTWRYYYGDGTMATSKWMKDDSGEWCFLGADGARYEDRWAKDSKSWYYMGSDGHPVKSKWMRDSKGWCYLGADGAMVTEAWQADSKGMCYLDGEGHAVTGAWKKLDGKWYYFDDASHAITNQWKKDSKGWLYMGEDGAAVASKWVRDSKGWCYVGPDAYMVTNKWAKDSKHWYYMGADGHMVTSKWQKDSAGWCYLGSDGAMVTSAWQADSKGWCYLDSGGHALASTTATIDGVKWKFDAACHATRA